MKLHNYQIKGVEFALKSKLVYNMVDLGLGKTAIALTVGSMLKYPMFVFAPLNVAYSTWPDEIKKWTPNLTYTLLHGKHKNTRLKLDRHIYLLNYDGIKWFYRACCAGKFRLRKFFVVFDESSMVKDSTTDRFKRLKDMTAMFSPYRMNLSATPAPNGLYELWPQYYLLDQGKRLGRVHGHFMNEHFIVEGPPTYKKFPKKGTADKMYKKVHDITYRLKGSDYLQLPPVTYNSIPVRLSPAEQKQYDSIEKEYLLELEGVVIPIDSDGSALAKTHQFVQGAVYTDASQMKYKIVQDHKLQRLKELVATAAGNPIMCAIWFKFEYEIICKALRYTVPVIAGGTTPRENALTISRWNAGKLPLLLVQPQSVKYGLNLQAGGHTLLWYTLTWSLETYKQLIGRLVRQGQTHSMIIHHLVMMGTIDELFIRVLRTKNATQNQMLEAMKKYMFGKFR